MKKSKKILSVVMSFVMIFTIVIPAFAAEKKKCDCGTAPVVQVRGIGETLYDGEGNEIFSADNIVNGILPAVPKLAEFLVTMDTDTLVEALDLAVTAIFGMGCIMESFLPLQAHSKHGIFFRSVSLLRRVDEHHACRIQSLARAAA